MLQIRIPEFEGWDEKNEIFVHKKAQNLTMEHSLVSISKWEAKYHKPFLSREEKTTEETIDYIRAMTLTQNVDPDVYERLTNENIFQIRNYIDNPMSATTFGKSNQPPNREIITSELIYYWMVASNIPFECQKWHLNRLLTLIRICSIKNQPPKKMSTRDILSRNAALNAARRKKYNTKG
jgi:hypothetical protein